MKRLYVIAMLDLVTNKTTYLPFRSRGEAIQYRERWAHRYPDKEMFIHVNEPSVTGIDERY